MGACHLGHVFGSGDACHAPQRSSGVLSVYDGNDGCPELLIIDVRQSGIDWRVKAPISFRPSRWREQNLDKAGEETRTDIVKNLEVVLGYIGSL